MHTEITMTAEGKEALPDLETLWNELNCHHAELKSGFKEYYRTRTFADRLSELQAKEGRFRVTKAFSNGAPCGYCICSVTDDGTGEIDSLVVGKAVRSKGTGSILLKEALSWLSSMNAAKIILSVYEGNDSAARFYRKHGFTPKYTVYEISTGELT